LALTEPDPQALRDRLRKVLAGAQRSAHLVHQLLALARNEAEVTLQPLDLAVLAREVARDWTPRAIQCGVDLGYEGADHAQVLGQVTLLREALNNLIDNALTYAGRGSEVTLRVRSEAHTVTLEVADTGSGLAVDNLPHVFERFWRATDQPDGCGLGLAIVAEVTQRHHGQVCALPNAPRGLRILMQLPPLTS